MYNPDRPDRYSVPQYPSMLSIVVLVVGCVIGLVLRVVLSNVDGPAGARNFLRIVTDTTPFVALALFAAMQRVPVVRRAVAVGAMAFAVLVSAVFVFDWIALDVDERIFLTALSTLLLTCAVLAWVLVRRRSLVTLVTAGVALIGGALLHFVLYFYVVFDLLNPSIAYVFADLILLASVVALSWIAVGIDAVAAPRTVAQGTKT